MIGVKLLPVVMGAGFLKILYGEKLNKIFNIRFKSLLNLDTSNFIFFKFYFKSKRSRFITFVHVDIKSARNLGLESSQA